MQKKISVGREASMFKATGPDNANRSGRTPIAQELSQALDRIGKIVSEVSLGSRINGHFHYDGIDTSKCPSCSGPKGLPKRLLVASADTATKINPVNAPAYWRRSAHDLGFDPRPEYISALTSKYWGPKPRQLSVSFMEITATNLRQRILSHMNAWTRTGCISFVETSGVGEVRISREQGGYWSYLGTDILHIPQDRQTMNLEGFTMATDESEYKRVVRHETGHTLGFPHEHMRKDLIARIDRNKIYDYALNTFGWDRDTVDQQILTPIDEQSLLPGSTPADQHSIMCYQLPGSVTLDGQAIVGGTDIDETDYEFCGLIYPRVAQSDSQASASDDHWPPHEDVAVSV